MAWMLLRRVYQHMVSVILAYVRGGSPIRSEYRAPCFQCGRCTIGHERAPGLRVFVFPSEAVWWSAEADPVLLIHIPFLTFPHHAILLLCCMTFFGCYILLCSIMLSIPGVSSNADACCSCLARRTCLPSAPLLSLVLLSHCLMRTFLMTKVSNSTSPIISSSSTPSALTTTPSSPILSSADFPALQVAAATSTTAPSTEDLINSNSSAFRDQDQQSQPQQAGDDNTTASATDANTTSAMTEGQTFFTCPEIIVACSS